MKDKVLAKLFEGFDKQLLSEEVQGEVSSLIDQMVAAKVGDATKQLQEKETKLKEWLAEQNKVLTEKEKALEEVATAFAAKCAKEAEDKEAVMFESIKEYMESAEAIAAESAQELREKIMQTTLAECEEYKKHIETVTLEELKEHKLTQEAVLAREVDAFKGKMVDSVGQYIDTRFEKFIPENIMEAAVQLAAYKPLVEGMIKTFGKSYIQFDSTGHAAIKEAKVETGKLTESLNAKVKDNVRLSARVKELERATKVSSLLEGFTAKQKERAKVLLEKYETDELDVAFKKIKDVVIEESVRKPAQTVVTENAKKQLQKLQESVDNPDAEKLGPEMGSWVKDLNRNLKS
jgi:hypothetical protein